MSVDTQYTAEGFATGSGRSGQAGLTSGLLTFTMAPPREMGGTGAGFNPEQLFAIGYAACFLSAMRAAARMEKLGTIPDDADVKTSVGIGPRSEGGFGLVVKITVSIPGVERELAEKMVERGHFYCPYSAAIRGNVDVDLTVV